MFIIKLHIENSKITSAHIYAIDGNLWGNGVKSFGDLVFDINDIDISYNMNLVRELSKIYTKILFNKK